MNHSTLERQAVSTDLQSTPQSAEGAVRSKDIEAHVPIWIANDVENAEHCEMDEMLKLFLLDCMVNESSTTEDPAVLLEMCLQSVLPICNGEVSKNGIDSAHIRNHLASYFKATDKAALCPAFVCAANNALFHLQDLDRLDSLRKPSGQLVFRVNGEVEEQSWYQEESSVCKPDVVLLPSVAVEVGGMSNDLLEGALEKPLNGSGWRDVRTVIELKTGPTSYPRAIYSKGKYIDPSRYCQYLVPMQPLSTSFIQKSESQGDYADNQSVSSVVENSATQKRKVASLETERESREGSSDGSEPSFKRQRVETSSDTDSYEVHSSSEIETHGTEMFASHAGRQHVICLTIIGDHLYLWRYDRQGAIQCSMNFILDLPRFLVLLLAMQRFQNQHWGLSPHVDPNFGKLSTASTTVLIEDRKEGQVDIVLDCSPHNRVYHGDLEGRATDLYPVTSLKFASKEKLVAKFFWCEESRASRSEPEILKNVYEIAEKEPHVQNHVPAMVFHHVFLDSSTALIRKRLRLQKNGARVLYVIVFEELMKITNLNGDQFLKCWWDTVKCHLALWKNGVHHCDVSASNLMYKVEADNVVGVLNDFDLATIDPGPTRNEHTGTIPFMSLELLTEKGWAGAIKHVYAHDAESFIWVLTWICLRYADGKLLERRLLDEWLKVDALGCYKKKLAFLSSLGETSYAPDTGHENNWRVARSCLYALQDAVHSLAPYDESCDWFQKLLEGPFCSVIEK